MSNKSPGVYITENDISTYTVADGTTLVAIVGYASKGPIGVPTVVNSYQKFVEIFGTPTIVGYSGLAIKNIFSVGNAIVFYRVADVTASVSKKIVKNAISAVAGFQAFEKNTDILVGTDNYINGKIYAINVAESIGENAAKKDFYVRAPLAGKLSLSDVLGQLSNQIGETSGYQEIKLPATYAKAGWYSFNFKVDDDVDADAINGIYPAEIGGGDNVCSFVELTTADKYETIKAKVETAAKTGSNPMAVLSLSNVGDSTFTPLISDYVGVAEATTFNAQFNLIVNGITYTIDVPVSPTTTFADLVDSINKTIKAYGSFCLFHQGDDAGAVPSKIVFVSKARGAGNTISIQPVSAPATGKQNLFVLDNSVSSPTDEFSYTPVNGINYIELLDYESIEGKSTKKSSASAAKYRFSIELDEYTKGMKFVSATTGVGSKISLIDGIYGVSLLDQTINGPAIGAVLNAINGTPAINLKVSRDVATKKIKFVSTGITPPSITSIESLPSYIGDFASIMLSIEAAVEGSPAIEASERDMIVISSIEKGSDTSLISVEKVIVSNPLDANSNYVNINVYYNGVLKETFADVSLDKNNTTNRFDIVINNTIENGGSAYVNIEFVKNEDGDIVNFPDGIYKLGNASTDADIAATEATNFDDYNSYDYAVGTNGIPSTGGSELFVDALSTTSELANTDLYNYHILITPDCIEQEVQESAIELAEFRKDFIYVCDPPFGITSEAVKRWHNGQGFGREVAIQSSYAATYWPWVKLYDTTNSKYVWCPPSTVIAAKYVSVDGTYGSWYAPAGELRGKITVGDIEYSPKLSERDDIYTGMNRVNPIIKFNDGRTIIYGEKTCLRENSALAKIHTRRMLLDIKKQVRAALQSFLFMPNVSDIWNKAAGAINAILEPYKRGGGISYYNTVIDSSTVTAEMQQQDIMAGTIHIVPTGVIEDIEISLNVDKVGETVTVE